MAAKKRTKQQREGDMAIIAKLICQGYTYRQIAEVLSSARPYTLSKQQISVDYKIVQEEWREARLNTLDFFLDKKIQEIELLKRSAWRGFEKSTANGSAGAAKFLNVIARAIQTEVRLMEVLRPIGDGKKIGESSEGEVIPIGNGVEWMDAEQVQNDFQRIMQLEQGKLKKYDFDSEEDQ